MADGFVSQAQYAAHRQVSRKTVTIWKQKGFLVFNALGKVDAAASDQALLAHGIGNDRVTAGNSRKISKAMRASAPKGYEELDNLEDPFDQGAMAMALSIGYRTGPLTASMTVGAGASCKVAYAASVSMKVAMIMEIHEIGRALGMANFLTEEEPSCWVPEYFDKINWEALAAMAGERVNLRAWKAYSATVCSDPSEDESLAADVPPADIAKAAT